MKIIIKKTADILESDSPAPVRPPDSQCFDCNPRSQSQSAKQLLTPDPQNP